MSAHINGLDRRNFLKTGLAGAAGLVIGFYLPGRREVLAASRLDGSAATPDVLNAFIQVAPDDSITILIAKSEMGQGVVTSLSMLAAEELECDWRKVRTEFAPAAVVYFDPAFHMQGTGGSQSINSAWKPMREAGATARVMLIAAAAQKWGVDPSECHAADGTVIHAATKRRATYGSLAEAAAKVTPPQNVTLKDPSQFTVIGKPFKRLDTAIKTNGKAGFGIDVRQPGMVHAVVERCPVFGGKVASFDATKAKAVPGVKDVFQISDGVAVVADNTWIAMQGRKALDVQWDEGPNANVSNETIFQGFADACQKPGVVSRKEGDAESALNGATQKIEAVYKAPYQAHATMEPMNCAAHIQADRADVWAPTQFQTPTQNTAAQIAGIKPDASFVHTTYLGGGFGRRGWSDFVTEACEISKHMKGPAQVTWSREDDTQHDYYRPASYVKISAAVGPDGNPTAFTARIACDSISRWFFGPDAVKNGMDSSSVEGISDTPYDIPNILVDYHMVTGPIPMGFWRSVGASQNGFFLESFMDELAAAAKKDPYEYRKALLAKKPRHLGVLNLAAEKGDWGKPLPKGHYRGIAVLEAFSTYVAEVVEISLDKDGVKVHKVTVALDCGRVVNPNIIRQQAVGAVVYGLTQTLKGEITIDKGRVQQANFDTYDMLRMNEMPVVDVYIVPSEETPTGMGEPAVPPVAPAICNAIFAATGKRIRHLPVKPEDLT
ncbi:MAG TPA: xanthine dehydrogenase family protein molybdopterin-binding subunit [Candidatus Acidoferrales bacterium]|nr:xanthine dehydrogenase family protein molybdopterin-binding subunit [Candidatus Acidoferrales bacterium]